MLQAIGSDGKRLICLCFFLVFVSSLASGPVYSACYDILDHTYWAYRYDAKVACQATEASCLRKGKHFVGIIRPSRSEVDIFTECFDYRSDFVWMCNGSSDGYVYDPSTQACIPEHEGCPEGKTPDVFGYCRSGMGMGPANLGECEGEGCCLGNPLNPATGNKLARVDLIEKASRFSIGFRLTYNSQAWEPSGFGNKWKHAYSRSIHYDPLTSIAVASRPDGKQIRFEYIDNEWRSTNNAGSELHEIADNNGVITGWKYISDDNRIEEYDAEGLLERILSGGIEVYELEYDAESENLRRIESVMGEYLEFAYNNMNYVKSVSDQAGRIWEFRYDVYGRLVTIVFPDGTPGTETDNPRREFHYNESVYTQQADLPYHLTGITDARGIRYATYEYYADGRARASYHAGNAQRVDIAYDDTTGTRTVTNSRGLSTTYTAEENQGIALIAGISGPGCSTCTNGGDTTYDYDSANNNLLSKTENGHTTQYGDYDEKGQYGYKVEAVGTSEERRIEYDYDPRFYNKISQIREPSVYPGAHKVTSYTHDDWGNRLTVTINGFDSDGNPVTRTTRYEYNGPLHQLSLIDGPRTDVSDLTHYRYYPNEPAYGNNRARLREVENAVGVLIRSNIQYTATGRVASETRPNGLQLSFTYYAGNDRLQTRTETDVATGESRTTRWTYLPTGEVETITQGYGTTAATTLTFGYDDARRLVRITDGLGNYIESTLDTEGNREAEKIYDMSGNLRKQLTRAFDLYNQLDTTEQANESVDYDYAPDGTLDRQTDGRNVATDYSYDALRRLTRTVQDDGGSDPTTADAATSYDYDAQDNLTEVTDPVDGTTTYAFDDLGNQVSQTSPDTGTTTFQYDAAGNLTQKTDAKGQVFTYSYDVLNRLTLIDGPGSDSDVTYTYDICPYGQGRLCSLTRGIATVEYRHNAFGYTAVMTQSVESWANYETATSTLSYGYDAAGRVAMTRYPSGAEVAYTYDSAGNVTDVTLTQDGSVTPLISQSYYHPFGPLFGATFGNGQGYYAARDMAYRQSWAYSGPYYGLINPYTGYDGNGNILMTFGAENQDFTYDALNRLDTASGAHGIRDYDYDANGNRTQLTADSATTRYGYTPQTNRLAAIDGDSQVIELDANGNTTQLRGMALSYTPDNRLKAVTGYADYRYNGLGQRVYKLAKVSGAVGQGDKRVFHYGQDGKLRVEAGPTGAIRREYIYLNGQPLAMLDYTPAGGEAFLSADFDGDGTITWSDFYEWYFLHYNRPEGPDPAYDVTGDGVNDQGDINFLIGCVHTNVGSCVTEEYETSLYYVHNDHLGTPKALTDEAGIEVWSATHTPFGQASVDADPDGDEEVVEFNLRFPGQYYDEETGLHYNYFRYYDPETGRYITSDPIGLEGGYNTYEYVSNNPLISIDINGLRRTSMSDLSLGTGAGIQNNVPNHGPGLNDYLNDYDLNPYYVEKTESIRRDCETYRQCTVRCLAKIMSYGVAQEGLRRKLESIAKLAAKKLVLSSIVGYGWYSNVRSIAEGIDCFYVCK